MTQTLYILCGLPFSGKTTLAENIVRERKNIVHICVDDHYSGDWNDAFQSAYEQTKKFLKQGNSVIFDATNFLKKERDKIRKIADEFGIKSKVIFVDVPENLAKSRLLKNRKSQNRKNVPDSDWNEVTTQLELPEKDENVIVYNPQKDKFKNWFEENIA